MKDCAPSDDTTDNTSSSCQSTTSPEFRKIQPASLSNFLWVPDQSEPPPPRHLEQGEPQPLSDQAPCPTCLQDFDRANRRADARYCSRTCQRNSARGTRTVADSPELRRRTAEHYRRAKQLAVDLYALAPFERLGGMAALIEEARTKCAQLRNILSDPKLLGAGREDRLLFHRRAPGTYKTIAQAADAYCRMFWGHGVVDVIFKRCPEPETGETDGIDTGDMRHSTNKAAGRSGIIFGKSAKLKPPARPQGWDYRVWVAGSSQKVTERIGRFAARHRTEDQSSEWPPIYPPPHL